MRSVELMPRGSGLRYRPSPGTFKLQKSLCVGLIRLVPAHLAGRAQAAINLIVSGIVGLHPGSLMGLGSGHGSV